MTSSPVIPGNRPCFKSLESAKKLTGTLQQLSLFCERTDCTKTPTSITMNSIIYLEQVWRSS